MIKRKKRKLGQNEGQGKGVFLALGIGGAVLVVGAVLALLVFKKDPKPPSQQAQASDENKTSESEDNGSLLPENTSVVLTNSVETPETSPSINPDLPLGKKEVWTYGTGKMDILNIYKGKTTNTLNIVFGEPDSSINRGNIIVYTYDQMKVLKDGKRYSTVRFTLQQESKSEAKVVAVSLDPRSVVASTPANSAAKQTQAEYEQSLWKVLARLKQLDSSGLDGKSVTPLTQLGWDTFENACNTSSQKKRYNGFFISSTVLTRAGTWLSENYDKTKKGVGEPIILGGKRISTAKDMAEICLVVFAGVEMAHHAVQRDAYTSSAILKSSRSALEKVKTQIFVNEQRLKLHGVSDQDVKKIRDAGYSKLQRMLNNQ